MQTSWVGMPFNYEARLHRGKAQIVDVTDRWKLNGKASAEPHPLTSANGHDAHALMQT
jgi:hypothetical protein